MLLGVPAMFLAQDGGGIHTAVRTGGGGNFDCPLRVAEGQGLDPRPRGRDQFAVPETILIWLPAARGESNAPLVLKVIAVRAATPRVVRRIRVFIFSFLFSGNASLRRRMFVLAIHRRAGYPAEFFYGDFPSGKQEFLSDFAGNGVE